MEDYIKHIGPEGAAPEPSVPEKDDWADWEKRIDALLLWACQPAEEGVQP